MKPRTRELLRAHIISSYVATIASIAVIYYHGISKDVRVFMGLNYLEAILAAPVHIFFDVVIYRIYYLIAMHLIPGPDVFATAVIYAVVFATTWRRQKPASDAEPETSI